MGFKINAVVVVSVEQPAAFAEAMRRLPDSISGCLCCERPVGRPPLSSACYPLPVTAPRLATLG
jgi:hypothetical protein